MFGDVVSALPRGQVRVIFTNDVSHALRQFNDWAQSAAPTCHIVTHLYDTLPAVQTHVNEALTALAKAAFVLWPDWYDRRIDLDSQEAIDGHDRVFADCLAAGGLLGTRDHVSRSWLKKAIRLCRGKKLPLPRGFSPAVQAAQLAMAINPANVLVLLGCTTSPTIEESLLGLARVAEWLATTTQARVLVVVPLTTRGATALTCIDFDARVLLTPQDDLVWKKGTEAKLRVWPVRGRPHPDSPAEMLLAERLADDSVLRGLFVFNEQVRSRFGSEFLVDLLWPEGRVVVEIDGYFYHGGQEAFSRDRQRDYELLVSGHYVLRIPHDEVMADVESALEKIRTVVRYRRGLPSTIPGEVN